MRIHVLPLLLATLATSTASAQQTAPADRGFGEVPVAAEFKNRAPRVERRDENDAAAGRVLLFPSAHTAHKGSLTVSTFMFSMNQLGYSFTDELQVAATVVLPVLLTADETPTVALSGKLRVHEGPNHLVSVSAFGQGNVGSGLTPAHNYGVGGAVLVDLMSSNSLVTTLGATGYLNLVRNANPLIGVCESRSEYLGGECTADPIPASTVFPAEGHFVALHAGLTWYFADHWSVRGEAVSGFSSGASFNLDRVLGLDANGFGPGFPGGSELTVGVGLQWATHRLAVQLASYFITRLDVTARESPVLTVPMLNATVRLF